MPLTPLSWNSAPTPIAPLEPPANAGDETRRTARSMEEERIFVMAARFGEVRRAIVLDVGAIAALTAEIEPHLSIDLDFAAQGLLTLRALKKHAGKGVWTYPHLLEILPAPHYEPLQRTFDLLVPDDSALVGYVI